jgi:hypothetical protein
VAWETEEPSSIDLFMEQYKLTPPRPGGYTGNLPELTSKALHELIEELREKRVIQ